MADVVEQSLIANTINDAKIKKKDFAKQSSHQLEAEERYNEKIKRKKKKTKI